MSKVIKKLFYVVSILAVLGSSVFATGIETEVNDSSVTVRATVTPKKNVILIVTEKDADILDYDNIFAMVQGVSDQDGKIELSFTMPDEKNGKSTYNEYDIYVKLKDERVLTGKWAYAPVEKRVDALNEIKRLLQQGGVNEELFDKDTSEYAIALSAMGLEIDKMYSLSVSTDTVALLNKGLIDDEITEHSIKTRFNNSLAAALIKNGENASSALSYTNFSFENVTYDNISEENLKIWIDNYYKQRKTFSDVEEFEDSYGEANALYIIDKAKFNQVEALLQKYKNELDITNESAYGTYVALKNKTAANDAIVQYFNGTPCITRKILLAGIMAGNQAGSSSFAPGGGGGANISGNKGSKPSGLGGSSVGHSTSSEDIIPVLHSVKDVKDAIWATDAINTLFDKKVILGDENGFFHPNREIKREEFVKMLVVALGVYDENATCAFSDVNNGAWYYSYVASAVNKGLICGMTETLFGSGEKLTRQDMMTIIYRANIQLPQKTRDADISDYGEISDYAKDAVISMYESGIISGMDDKMIAPKAFSTKAQAAQIIYNLLFK